MRRPSALDALSEREFRLFFTAQASSFVGDGMVPVALAFAVLEVTGSATDLGLVLAARWVPLVALLLAGGVMADRVSRRRAMIAADLVRLGAQGLLAVLLLTGGAEIWHMVVLQGVHGAATAVFNPATTGLVPLTVSAAACSRPTRCAGWRRPAARSPAPPIAGVLVATVGAGWAIAVDAGSFARQRPLPRRPAPAAPGARRRRVVPRRAAGGLARVREPDLGLGDGGLRGARQLPVQRHDRARPGDRGPRARRRRPVGLRARGVRRRARSSAASSPCTSTCAGRSPSARLRAP